MEKIKKYKSEGGGGGGKITIRPQSGNRVKYHSYSKPTDKNSTTNNKNSLNKSRKRPNFWPISTKALGSIRRLIGSRNI